MSFTRRDILLASSTLPLLSGCTRFSDDSPNIANLEIILVNGQDKSLTFGFALETSSGRQEWSSNKLNPKSKKAVMVEPPKKHKLVAIHGSVAGHTIREELLNYNSQKVCPKIYIEYELADEPTILQGTDTGCN